MKLLQLLEELHSRAVILRVTRKGLTHRSPSGALTPNLIRELGKWKPTLLHLLSGQGDRLGLDVCGRSSWPDFHRINQEQWEALHERTTILVTENRYTYEWANLLAALQAGLIPDLDSPENETGETK